MYMGRKAPLHRFGSWLMRGWHIYQFLIWLGGTSFITYITHSVSNTVQASPIIWQIVIYVGIASFVLLAVRILLPYLLAKFRKGNLPPGTSIPQKHCIEFYRTRQELATSRGLMAEELGDTKVKKLWVAWWTGISATANRLYEPINIKRSPPIDRMILLSPYGEYLKSHALIEGRTVDEIRTDILHTKELFSKVGVPIEFFDGYIEGMIIADTVKYADEEEFSDVAWVRIEPCVPYKNTVNACNYVVYKKHDEVLFNSLVKSFLFLWNKEYECKVD